MKNFTFLFYSIVFCVSISSSRLNTGKPTKGTPTIITSSRLKSDPSIQEVVNQVDSARIYAILAHLEAYKTRYAGSASGRDSLAHSRDWIIAQFTSYGYTDIIQHTFTQGGNQLQNIIVTKPGILYPDSVVIVCGHYDTVNGPGINDNGTGTALVMEAARIFASKQLNFTVRFICFSGEEEGLVGSNAYVQEVVVPQQHKLKLILNLDEVGGVKENVTNIIKVEEDESNPPGNNAVSAFFTDSLASLTRTYSSLQTTITNAFGTDYVPFQTAGYIITGYYEYNQTPHYHQPTDSLSHVDMHYVKEICKGTIAGIASFAGLKGKFVTLFHSPLSTSQDTTSNYPVLVKSRSSATVDSALIFYSINAGLYQTSSLTFAGLQNDTSMFTGTIPKQPYGSIIRYYFSFHSSDDASAFLPADTSAPFSFSILPDTIAPVIIYTVPASISYLDFPLRLPATISDANSIELAWVEWTHNGIGATDTMEQLSQDHWSATITDSVAASDSITYVIYARDNSLSHNTTRIPASGNFHFTILNSQLLIHSIESDSGDFAATNDWQFGNPTTIDIPPSPTGLKVWGTNLSGNYTNNITSLLETPSISLLGKKNATLVFQHFYKTEPGNDGGNIEISVDGGEYQLLIPQNGYPYSNVGALNAPGYAGNSTQWKEERVNLSAYQNHSITLLWKFASDALTSFRGWYVDAIRLDYLPDSTQVSVRQNNTLLPAVVSLEQNYPNPFNPATEIRFQIPSSGFVTLKVFDILGQDVSTLLNGTMDLGRYNVRFDASALPSGLYFYQLRVHSKETYIVQTRKMILSK